MSRERFGVHSTHGVGCPVRRIRAPSPCQSRAVPDSQTDYLAWFNKMARNAPRRPDYVGLSRSVALEAARSEVNGNVRVLDLDVVPEKGPMRVRTRPRPAKSSQHGDKRQRGHRSRDVLGLTRRGCPRTPGRGSRQPRPRFDGVVSRSGSGVGAGRRAPPQKFAPVDERQKADKREQRDLQGDRPWRPEHLS
jgi:hypothetical protein